MSKAGFSLSDLQQGAKSLAPSESKSSSSASAPVVDVEALRSLENLYRKYDGDLDLIFDELASNPSKAKKPHHKPKDAKEFASKYLEGYYSVIDDHADAKLSSRK